MNQAFANALTLLALTLLTPLSGTAQSEPGAASSVATATIDPAAYRALVAENLAIRQERDRLALDIVELRKRNASLLVEIQDIERRRDSLAALLAEMKTPEDTRAELARLQTERGALMEELDRLRKASSLAQPEARPAPAPGSDLFRRLEKENADLRMELSEVRNDAQAENRKRETSETGEKKLKAASLLLAEQVASLRRELEAARKTEAQMKEAMTQLGRKVYMSKTELQRLQEELAAEKARKGKPVISREPVKPPETRREQEVGGAEAEGRKAMAAGKPREAERLFQAALQKTPDSAKLHYNLGVLYGDYLGDPGKAAFHYRKYLELDPAAPDAATVRSWLMELDLKSKW